MKKDTRVLFACSAKEKEMLDKICESTGSNQSELMRELLRNRYSKLFPVYIKTSRDFVRTENLTPEQQCEKFGGVVEKDSVGNRFCKFKKPGTGIVGTVSISKTEAFESMATRMGL